MFKQLMNKEVLPHSLLCAILVCLTVFFLVGCQRNYTPTGSATNNGNQGQGSTASGGSGSKGSTSPTGSTVSTSSTNSGSGSTGSGSGSGSIAPCQTQQLQLAFDKSGAAMNNDSAQFALANQSQQSCTLSGYPALQFLDAQFQPVQERVSQVTAGFMYPPQVPHRFVLQPGGKAYFVIAWGNGYGTNASQVFSMQVTPPLNQTFLKIPIQFQFRAFRNNSVELSPLEPNKILG